MVAAQMIQATSSRHADFKRLLHAAARELNVKRSDGKARRLAVVRLQRMALAEVQERDLLNGRLSDPGRLLDADARLAEEERRLSPATGDHGVTVNIQPYVLCARCQQEVHVERPPPVVALPVPLSYAASVEAKPEASKPKPSNVVELKHLTASEIVDRAGCTKPTSRSR